MTFTRDLAAHLWRCIGRRDSYAVQLANGTYARVCHQVTLPLLLDHLNGEKTLGTYVIDERGLCSFAVLDADQENGLDVLRIVQAKLAAQDGASLHLESSRRGGHGWLWFERAVPAAQVREWLSPIATRYGLELYPKQNAGQGVGSLIRVPFGVHRRSGRRYPFLAGDGQPLSRTVEDALRWLSTASCSPDPPRVIPSWVIEREKAEPKRATSYSGRQWASIREWNAAHDPVPIIGRHVELDSRGMGHCPFGEHHAGGRDHHRSFQVYQPHQAGGYCWLCHAGEIGGSLFDFLARWHGKSASELWYEIVVRGGYLW